MVHRVTSLWQNTHLRELVGSLGILAVFVVFTDMTLRTIVPIVVLLSGLVGHDIADDRYGLPNGANVLVYGATVVVAGAYWALIGPTPWVGSVLAVGGLWFVFDGATTIRYEPSQTTHEYVADLDGESGAGEAMLRMQTLNVVYQTLRDATEPATVSELATDVDLTESRVASALGFLESKGQVERIDDRYRAEPPRWGRLTPVVSFLTWLPKRTLRPFRRIAAAVQPSRN